MAVEKWITIKTQWCDVIGREAELLERRVYPPSHLPDTEPFRVLGRRCSAALECNLRGGRCKWAYTEPTLDRFALGQ